MALVWPDKDPDEVLDYTINWTSRLVGEVIATSSWIVPAGITSSNQTNTTAMATIWLSGGTVGQVYILTNRITTGGGRTMDQSVQLRIREK